MAEKQNQNALDMFRLVAAMLVIANHTSPLSSFSADADLFLTRILARISVPFFFMITGHFVVSHIIQKQDQAASLMRKQIKKLCLLYAVSIVLYLPLGIYAGHYNNLTFLSAIQMLLFDGTFYHLWYFPACIIGILLIYGLSRIMHMRIMVVVASLLYLFGLFGDSYYGVVQNIPVLESIYTFVFRISSYTRNGLFFAPIFLLIGVLAAKSNRNRQLPYALIGFVCSFLLMTVEGFLLHNRALPKHDSMYLMLIPVMYFLYQLLRDRKMAISPHVRHISTWMYILHPAIIVVVRGLAKLFNQTVLLIDHSLIHYCTVTALSIISAVILSFLLSFYKRDNFKLGRAWIELSRNALKHNVQFLQTRLPENCRLMAAVKADAYGHGATLISHELNRLGVYAFCVASISEAIALRKSGVRGEILILGYTHPNQFGLIKRYRLTQTVLDHHYALLLNQYGKKLHVHIAIDTGMHRLGERCENLHEICAMFQMKNLIIDGIFSHLAASDCTELNSRRFTEQQIDAFNRLIANLKQEGVQIPSTHLQASYGVLNYPTLVNNYARVGIALYGILSTKEDVDRLSLSLKPVLSLKARVASVRTLYQNEYVGYGMAFTAMREMKIAVITIGYADGLPRSLSNGVGSALIHGHKAPIVGRVCMDQTIIDVTHIPNVAAGDIVTIIGSSGSQVISAGDLALQTNTITNELLSRLGSRLERIIQ